MKKSATLGLALLLSLAACGIASAQSGAPTQPFVENGHQYYIVDGNSDNMNSGDRVCGSMGMKCVGYTDFSTKICRYYHPTASDSEQSLNGSKSGFYCDGKSRSDIACNNVNNNCQVCPQCGVNADCAQQVGTHFAEMYVECVGTSTTPLKDTVITPPASSSSGGWLSGFTSWLHNLWLGLGWITPSGAPTGANHPASTPPPPHQGTKTPGQVCNNGGECKSGNCNRDDSGVYRCSCTSIGLDFSHCN